jgi:hypothetical protein
MDFPQRTGTIGLKQAAGVERDQARYALSLPYHDWRMPPELHRAD